MMVLPRRPAASPAVGAPLRLPPTAAAAAARLPAARGGGRRRRRGGGQQRHRARLAVALGRTGHPPPPRPTTGGCGAGWGGRGEEAERDGGWGEWGAGKGQEGVLVSQNWPRLPCRGAAPRALPALAWAPRTWAAPGLDDVGDGRRCGRPRARHGRHRQPRRRQERGLGGGSSSRDCQVTRAAGLWKRPGGPAAALLRRAGFTPVGVEVGSGARAEGGW